MSKKTQKNVKNARQTEIDKYYDIFLKRYKYQLSLNQTADSPSLDERFENYSRIINTIAGEPIVSGRTRQIRYNNNNNNNKSLSYSEGVEQDKLKYYAIKIIKKMLKVKENILINPIFKNMSLISTHGACTTEFFKIPDNLMICILTPLNRMLFSVPAEFITNIIDNLQNPNFNNSFLSNPSCYLRDTENSLLEFATTFYPGQMCNDLVLEIKPAEKRIDMAYFKIDPSNPTTLRDTNIDRASTNSTTLSELIKYKNISGILFVSCCRSCDLDVSLIEETNKIYILETFTDILNKTIDNPGYMEYNLCNLFKYYDNFALPSITGKKYIKSRKLNIEKFPEFQSYKKRGNNIYRALNMNKTRRNSSLAPKSQDTRIYFPNIFALDKTDKTKYEELNDITGLNDPVERLEFNIDKLNLLFNTFKDSESNLPSLSKFASSLSKFANATNYVWSYIFYNYFIIPNDSVELRKNIVFINKLLNNEHKSKEMTIITALHFSGDISNNNLRFIFTKLNFFHDVFIEDLDISRNNSLMSLDFITMPKSLKIIRAYNCNILFVDKSILDLDNLEEIHLFNNSNISFSRISFNYRKISEESFSNIDDEIKRKALIREREFINQQLQNQTDSDLENINRYDLQIKFREAHKKFCDNILLYDDLFFRNHNKYILFYNDLVDYKDNIIKGWQIDVNKVNKKYVKFAGIIFYSKEDFFWLITNIFNGKFIDFDKNLFINNTKNILGFQGFEETTIIDFCNTFIYEKDHKDTILYNLLIDNFPKLD